MVQNGNRGRIVCVCMSVEIDDRTQILVCTMKSQALTHLILVREVVGIKGLRREKPPEETNGVKQTGF